MSAIELAPARLITSVASASRSGTSSKKPRSSASMPESVVDRAARGPCPRAAPAAPAAAGARSSGVEQRQRLGHHAREEPGALAAADHQEPHRPVARARHRSRRAGRAPPRAPGCRCARACAPGRQRRRPGAAGDHVDPRREDAVDPAEHAVLLVDQAAGPSAPAPRSSPAAPDSRRSPRRRPAGRGASRRRLAARPGGDGEGRGQRGSSSAALGEGRGGGRPAARPRAGSRRRSARRARRWRAAPASRAPASPRPAPGRGTCARRCRRRR